VTPAQQVALLEKVCKNEDHPETIEEEFFVAVKRATITGYYTSEIGIHQEIGIPRERCLAGFCGVPAPESQDLGFRIQGSVSEPVSLLAESRGDWATERN